MCKENYQNTKVTSSHLLTKPKLLSVMLVWFSFDYYDDYQSIYARSCLLTSIVYNFLFIVVSDNARRFKMYSKLIFYA